MHISIVIRLLLVLICTAGVLSPAGSQSSSDLEREGDTFYDNHMYRSALRYYRQVGNAQTWDKDLKLRVAVCRYEINDVEGAIGLLNDLVEQGKTEPLVYFYLGRAHQHRRAFRVAAANYKQFIRRSNGDDPRRAWVKDELLRCASGDNLRFASPLAYVENLGTAINTFYDETSPVPSPSQLNRLYFSSSRENVSQDKYAILQSDLYYAEMDNGIWRNSTRMQKTLNSRQHEWLYSISRNGQQLYFFRGPDIQSGHLMIDTFSVDTQRTGSFKQFGPFNPSRGDRDLCVFNDSMMLFASAREGGFGGYDLYYSMAIEGVWGKAKNLGKTVNSHYDEVSPFLVRNGRKLYFSSNRLTSMGGLDVFQSRFDDQQARWDAPQNLGPPINSAGDDIHFRVSADGLTAFFASDRKSGYGKRDIYAAYMKETVEEHLALSAPVTFAQVVPPDTELANDESQEPVEIKEFYINNLSFDESDVVLTPQNIKSLDVIANLLLIFPKLTADLVGHDVPSGPRSFTLYFSVKKAEQAAQYLMRKGIDKSRLYVMGTGAYYPQAKTSVDGRRNPAAEGLNRRIEVRIRNVEEEPLSLIYARSNIPSNIRDPRGPAFTRTQQGLVYRIHIATVSQMFQHAIFNDVDHALISLNPVTNQYEYFVGMEENFNSALSLRDQLIDAGLEHARITVFYGARELDEDDILNYTGDHPDLLDYLDQKD